jgi:hypothetical protein
LVFEHVAEGLLYGGDTADFVCDVVEISRHGKRCRLFVCRKEPAPVREFSKQNQLLVLRALNLRCITFLCFYVLNLVV